MNKGEKKHRKKELKIKNIKDRCERVIYKCNKHKYILDEIEICQLLAGGLKNFQ